MLWDKIAKPVSQDYPTLVVFYQETDGSEYEQLFLFFWLVQIKLLSYGSRAETFSL